MRVLLILGTVLLFTLVFADYHKGHHEVNDDHHEQEHDNDHHDHKDDNDHHDHKDGHHKKGEDHRHNKSLPFHKIANYNSRISFHLFRQVALDHPSENIVFSPVSISMAFAFLPLGAKAQTHSQIIDGLHLNTFEISEQQIHEGSHHLLDPLNNVDKEPTSQGKWQNPFDENLTQEGDFHLHEKTTVKVPFMIRRGHYDVAINDDATMVSIPFKGDAEAIFIMPKEGKLSEIEQNFNKEAIKKMKKSMRNEFVELHLPKFSISGTIDLKETLSKMGKEDIFSPRADLSGITGEPNIKISRAVHKAVLSIDEKGTEAAGSTAMEAIPMMLPPRVRFDRPFMFSLYDYKTRSALFMGKIVNPQK